MGRLRYSHSGVEARVQAYKDPVVKSQHLTNANGNVVATVELDPWGGEATMSWQQWQQPQRYTSVPYGNYHFWKNDVVDLEIALC